VTTLTLKITTIGGFMKIGFWYDRINGVQAIGVLDSCIQKMFEQEKWNVCTPPGDCKTFIQALQFFENEKGITWFIQYNDSNGSTKTASVKISDEELESFNIVEDFIV
jgi:hypothetical protein